VHLRGEYDFSEEKMRDSIGFNFSQIVAFKLDEKWDEGKIVLIDMLGNSIFSTPLYAEFFY
jgi:hypothetical protein